MKNKILSLAILIGCLGFVSVPAMAYDDPAFAGWSNKSNLAQAQGIATPVRVLKLVRNSNRDQNNAGIDSGDVVVYDTNSKDGVTVRTTTTSGDAAIAGIAVTSIPSADSASASATEDWGKRNWGWIVVHGPAIADCTSGTCGAVAGNVFRTSGDAGSVGTPVSSAGHYDAQLTQARNGGFFMETPAGGQTRVFVQLE